MDRSIGLLVLVGALAISLTGCAPDRPPFDGDPSSTPEVSSTTTPTVPPIVSPTLAPGSIAFHIGCSDLVSDQAIYEWGSGNWAADPAYTAAPGSTAAEIVEFGGSACGWINLTSNETLSVAIGEFTPASLETLRQKRAESADAVSDFGADGYFAVTSGTGQADAFTGPYWITASSTWFLSAGDAADIVKAALGATD